jgi:Fur family ferric uptake transcriptional regulator
VSTAIVLMRDDSRARGAGPPGSNHSETMKAPVERNTRQKQAIRNAFERVGRPLSTEEVHLEAERSSRGLGMATVYRSIRALLDDGWLSVVEVPGRNPLYEIAGKDHHHHFSCTDCARVFELEGCASVDVSLPAGFRTAGHELTFYGTCDKCTPKRAAARKVRGSKAG